MKTNIRRIPAVLLLVVLCLAVFPISAFAAGTMEVKIPVSIELSGETPSPEETYTVVLQAVDDAPMPSESTLKIQGSGMAVFPAIRYSTPGIYCYTVAQQIGDHERGHYDETVYYVKVTVTNAKFGGLEAVVAAHTDEQMVSPKQDIVFSNTYDTVKNPSDSDDPGSDTPNSDEPKTDDPKADSSKPGSNTTISKPKTGDSTNIVLFMSLFFVSGGILFLLVGADNRKK